MNWVPHPSDLSKKLLDEYPHGGWIWVYNGQVLPFHFSGNGHILGSSFSWIAKMDVPGIPPAKICEGDVVEYINCRGKISLAKVISKPPDIQGVMVEKSTGLDTIPFFQIRQVWEKKQ